MHLPCCRLSPSMAASSRALKRFSSFLLLLMVVLIFMPGVHSSRTSFSGGGRAVAEQRTVVAQELGRNLVKGSFGNGEPIFKVEQRQVPTGPDPLHHNNNPTGP